MTRFTTVRGYTINNSNELKEKQKMKYKRNQRTPQGYGIPDVPQAKWKLVDGEPIAVVNSDESTDSIGLVLSYLENRCGCKDEARRQIKSMSGFQILEMAEQLKNQRKNGTKLVQKDRSGREYYSAPVPRWHADGSPDLDLD